VINVRKNMQNGFVFFLVFWFTCVLIYLSDD